MGLRVLKNPDYRTLNPDTGSFPCPMDLFKNPQSEIQNPKSWSLCMQMTGQVLFTVYFGV